MVQEREPRLDAAGHAHGVIAVQQDAQVVVQIFQCPLVMIHRPAGANVTDRLTDAGVVVINLTAVQHRADHIAIVVQLGPDHLAKAWDRPDGRAQAIAGAIVGVSQLAPAQPGVAQEALVRPLAG